MFDYRDGLDDLFFYDSIFHIVFDGFVPVPWLSNVSGWAKSCLGIALSAYMRFSLCLFCYRVFVFYWSWRIYDANFVLFESDGFFLFFCLQWVSRPVLFENFFPIWIENGQVSKDFWYFLSVNCSFSRRWWTGSRLILFLNTVVKAISVYICINYAPFIFLVSVFSLNKRYVTGMGSIKGFFWQRELPLVSKCPDDERYSRFGQYRYWHG